jgi:uncharacterized protein with beta-barrel porin domain
MPRRPCLHAALGLATLLASAFVAHGEEAGAPAARSWRSWSSLYAGRSFIGADAATGTPGVSASVAGLTLGTDTLLGDNTLVGASFSASRQTFSSGTATGVSDDRAIALYGRQRFFGAAYLSGALGYGWHDIDTSRTLRLGSTTILQAMFQAQDAGGRLEAGYGFALGGRRGLSPYVALVGDAYRTPSYQENAATGSPRFAASFSGSTIGMLHGELGAHYEDGWTLPGGDLSLELLGGWEHELADNPFVLAAFLADPSNSFLARGTRPPIDTGLAGLGLRFTPKPGFSVGLRGDTRLGARTTIFSGTLDATFNW